MSETYSIVRTRPPVSYFPYARSPNPPNFSFRQQPQDDPNKIAAAKKKKTIIITVSIISAIVLLIVIGILIWYFAFRK
jgi:hypothetical protein